MPLNVVTTQSGKRGRMLFGFHALGHHAFAECVGSRDDGGRHASRVVARSEILDKALVNLHR
jgi:hypothetical protein